MHYRFIYTYISKSHHVVLDKLCKKKLLIHIFAQIYAIK